MFGSLVNRIGGMALQFLSILLISRLIGAEGIGAYAVYTSWMLLLATIGGMGTSISVVRTVAVSFKLGHFAEIQSFLFRVCLLLILVGLTVTVVIYNLADTIGLWFSVSPELQSSLQLAALGGVAFMLLRVAAETLKGMDQFNLSMGMENVIIPAGLMLVSFAWFHQDGALTARVVIISHIALVGLVFCLMCLKIGFILRRDPHRSMNQKRLPVWNAGQLSMWGSSFLGMMFLNIPLLLLPVFASSAEIGIFSVAYRFINISVSLLMVVAGIYGPKFAVAYSERDFQALAYNLKQTRVYSMVFYAPLFVVFTALPGFAMGLFGEEFKRGADLLMIMAIGQLVYSSTGLVGTMMNMIHKEREEFMISLCASVLMILFVYVLGRTYGLYGVAVGFGLGLSLKNLISWWRVSYYLKSPQLL